MMFIVYYIIISMMLLLLSPGDCLTLPGGKEVSITGLQTSFSFSYDIRQEEYSRQVNSEGAGVKVGPWGRSHVKQGGVVAIRCIALSS
jgi:hypothetical protein